MSGDIQYGMTAKDRKQMLKVHNYARKQVNVEPIVWDKTLAKHAEDYGKGCIWGHWSQHKSKKLPQPCFKDNDGSTPVVYVDSVASGPCPAGSGPPGENLGMGYPTVEQRCERPVPSDKNIKGCIRSSKKADDCGEGKPGKFCPCKNATKGGCTAINWYNEIHDHNCGKPINEGDCRAEMCGHYTQMVSRMSKRVGCAAVRCPSLAGLPAESDVGMDFVVCEYFPHGNIVGELSFSPSACEGLDRGLPLGEEKSPKVAADNGKSSPAAPSTSSNNGNNNSRNAALKKKKSPGADPNDDDRTVSTSPMVNDEDNTEGKKNVEEVFPNSRGKKAQKETPVQKARREMREQAEALAAGTGTGYKIAGM